MKTFTIKTALFLLVTFSLFTSCTKDDDPGGEVVSDIIGTWTIDGSTVDITVDGVDLIAALMEALEITQTEAELFASFFTAGYGGDVSGTITFKSDNTYTATFPPDDQETGKWKVSSDGKTLTMNTKKDDGTYYDDDVLTIKTLTSTTMVLLVPSETEMEDIDDDGTDETLEISMEITLSK